MIEFHEEKQNKRIAQLRHKEEEAAVQRAAQQAGIPYLDLTSVGVETDALALIPEKEARELEMAGFKIVGKDLYIAIRTGNKPGVREKLQFLQKKGYNIGVYLVSHVSLEKAWDRYNDIRLTSRSHASLLDISQESLQQISEQVKNNQDIKGLIADALQIDSRSQVSRILEILFGSAISTKSSDIHFEPQEEDMRIRFRQDGILEDIYNVPSSLYRKILSRIKILSHLKISQEAKAQDGRFTVDYKEQEIEIRVSIVPSAYGEGVVMRILNPDAISVSLEKLGIEPRLFEILQREIKKPNGMILTTGPTGSGKTTTLYAFLKEIYEPGIKILTIEDPIEYHLEGITQTQTNNEKGYTFLSGLRGALRQDPDVIMVGEIRDNETAAIAVNASLTGHMVFSTLHTNNAAGAIPRLLDLKINPKVVPASLSLSIAQRLVRKLCPQCKVKTTIQPRDEEIMRKVLAQASRNGKDLGAYNLKPNQPITTYGPKEGGCEACGGKGYKGRIGLFEAVLADENIERLITQNPSEREIRRVADKQGIFTMQEDGVMKVLAGVTSLDEIQRILDIAENLDPEDNITVASETQTPPTPPKKPTQPQSPKQPDYNSVQPPKKQVAPNIALPGMDTPPKKPTTPAAQSIPHNPNNEDILPQMTVADLAQIIRDVEVDVLINKLKKLEEEQHTHPSKDIYDEIIRIRNIIIDILKHTPPKKPMVTIDGKGNIIREEISLLMNELLDLENHQTNNPHESAAPRLGAVRSQVEKHLKK